jgi:hypothetical protein
VWEVFSEFWLDTELDSQDHARIAAVLRESGYPLATLAHICRDEVSPVVRLNLLSVAGVWSGFDPVWLRDSILQRLAHPSPYDRLLKALRLSRPGAMLGAWRHWYAVEALLQQGAQ